MSVELVAVVDLSPSYSWLAAVLGEYDGATWVVMAHLSCSAGRPSRRHCPPLACHLDLREPTSGSGPSICRMKVYHSSYLPHSCRSWR